MFRRYCFLLLASPVGVVVGLCAEPPKPSLGVAGAGSDPAKTVTIQTDSGYVNQLLRIDSLNPEKATDVEVRFSPFVGAKQRWVTPAWQCWQTEEQRGKCAKGESCTKVSVEGLKEAWCRVTAYLPEPDTYTGKLDLIYNQARDSYKLAITRGPDETLLVRGIDKDTEYTSEPALFELATGISSKTLRAVPNVHVIVHDLIGSAIVKPKVVLNGQTDSQGPIQVPGNGEIPLKISMNLPIPGTYKGAVELLHGGIRDIYTFNVKRAEAKAPVTIRPIEAVRANTSPIGTATLRVILEGTRSVPFELDLPYIAALSRKEGDKVSAGAGSKSIKFKQEGQDAELASGSAVKLEDRTAKNLLVEISGLQPGEYTGLFAIGTKDLGPQEAAFSIYVRRDWWIAALLIAAGVVLSWWLRSMTLKSRPRLAAQRQLSQLADDIDATFSEVADATPAFDRLVVKVRPFREGSFVIDLVLSIQNNPAILFFLTHPEAIERIKKVLEYLGLINKGREIFASLLELIEHLKNGKPAKIEPAGPDTFNYYNNQGQVMPVTGIVHKLINNTTIQNFIFPAVGAPLQRTGVDAVSAYLSEDPEHTRVKIQPEALPAAETKRRS